MNKNIKHIAFKIVNICFSLFPIKRNRIFFTSFYGQSYSDNPKAISKALYEKYGSDFEHVWVLDHPTDDVPAYIRTCRNNTLKMLYYMSTSKVWVSNSCMQKGAFKKKGQYYIQTWHGDRGFKMIAHGVKSHNDYIFETDHADLFIAGSQFGVQHYYRECFGYQGEIAMTGCPRNDIFFKNTPDLEKEIRNKYGIAKDSKVVLFAPTFREKYKDGQQDVTLDLERVRKALENATSKKWVVLVRSHLLNSKYGMSSTFNEHIISATDYPDMNELLKITDILISDYSSSIGDFSLSGRLCLLYQDDIKDYTSQDRSLVFDINQSPFFHFSTPEEVYQFLSSVEKIDSRKNCDAINRFYETFEEGNASVKVADIIKEKCNNKS